MHRRREMPNKFYLHGRMQMRLRLFDDENVTGLDDMPQIQDHWRQLRYHG